MKKFKSVFSFVSTAFLILNVMVLGPVTALAQEVPSEPATDSKVLDVVQDTPSVDETFLTNTTSNEDVPISSENVITELSTEPPGEQTIDEQVVDDNALVAPAMRMAQEESVTPVINSCPVPDSEGDTEFETVKPAKDGEQNLQAILDAYSLDATTDQTHIQSWALNGSTNMNIKAKFISRNAKNNAVFGYYYGGTMETFVPMFTTGTPVGTYSYITPSSVGSTASTSSGAETPIGFMIRTYTTGDVYQLRYATQKSINPGGVDKVLVYNPSPDTYVLAFEDIGGGTDNDFNDLVVELKLDCHKAGGDPEPDTVKVHILKYLNDGTNIAQMPDDASQGAPMFPMNATWKSANLNGGASTSGDYVLGNNHGNPGMQYNADTAPMSTPADYTTYEKIDGSTTVADREACKPGAYYLEGYKSGTDLDSAETADLESDAPVFTGLTSDRYLIVVNHKCANDTDGSPTHDESTTTVRQADLTNTANDSQWYFYNDTTDLINNAVDATSIGGFTPDHARIGLGSAILLPLIHANDRTVLATSKYGGTKLADITSLSFSEYTPSGPGWSASEAPFVRFNVDFTGGSSAYQNSLVYVPSVNNPVNQNAWSDWDMINSGSAKWVYSGATWPAPIGDPGTTPKTWNEILAAYPNIEMSAAYPFIGIRAGEPGPVGFSTFVDNVIVGIKTGSNTHTETYDFEPTTNSINNTDTNGSSGGNSKKRSSGRSNGLVAGASTSAPQGEVLGAETSCGIYVDKFLKKGKTTNDVASVIKVQKFLNDYTQAGIPVDGNYGAKTEAALRAFQLAHKDKILFPWNLSLPTGIFYLTTQTEVNNIMCPTLNLPIPTNLIPYSKNPVTPKI